MVEIEDFAKSEYVKSETQSFVDEGNKSFYSAGNRELKREDSYKFGNQNTESRDSLHDVSGECSNEFFSDKMRSRSAHNCTSNHSSNRTTDRRSYAE
jgi:hypothetical protein